MNSRTSQRWRTLATARIGFSAAASWFGRAGSAGERAANELDELKGLAMKLGQWASYLDGAADPESQEALARLRDSATPDDRAAIEGVLRAAYGKPSAEVFEAFDPVPFAAASIGQVHRAQVDGRDVAVKVQYPDVRRAIEIDLVNLQAARPLNLLGRAVQAAPLFAEIRERVQQELDYRQEGAYQAQFKALFADEPAIAMPDVLTGWCRDQVLVTAYSGATRFDAFARTASQEARDRAAMTLFRFAWRSIFTHGLFHADPHPGNFLFEGGPANPTGERVVVLDFGCVRPFPAPFVERWKALARVVIERRRADWPEACLASGIVANADGFDFEHEWELMSYLYAPVLTPRWTFDADYVKRGWDVLVTRSPNRHKTALPREWFVANRLNWGLYSTLGRLGASGAYADAFRLILERSTACVPPATRL